jgi:glycerate kinase
VIAFAGSVSEDPEVHAQFDAIVPIVDGVMELGEAMGEAPRLLERAAARTARMLKLKLR